MLLWSLAAASAASLGAALCHSIVRLAACEILVFAFASTSSASTIIAETALDSRRASWLGYVGTAAALGGSACLVLMPIVGPTEYSFRWALLISVLPAVFLPKLAGLIPESNRWEKAFADGAIARSSALALVAPPYRSRALPLLGAVLLGTIGSVAVLSWTYYYGVSVVGVPASYISTWSLIANMIGILGLRLGAWSAERHGRVPTVVVFGIAGEVAALWGFLGPPAGCAMPALWLGVGYCWGSLMSSACSVAGNSAGAELFPTAIRATLGGWVGFIVAGASAFSQLLVASLIGPLGGLSHTIAAVSLVGLGGAAIFGFYIPETRGIPLEIASGEVASLDARSETFHPRYEQV